MKKWKRSVSALLVLILLVGLLPPVQTAALPAWEFRDDGLYQPTHELVAAPQEKVLPQNTDLSDYLPLEEAAMVIRQGALQRQSSLSVKVASTDDDYQSVFQALQDCAWMHTGDPKQGDSLRWQYSSCRYSVSYGRSGGITYYAFDLTYTYFTTAQQEAELDVKVAQVLAQLNLDGKSDYQKVKAIYTWLCENVTYDYDSLNNPNDRLAHSAYAAMLHGTAVCQGYALAFYRMALELGIDNRFIAGMGGGGRHAWNIVELENLYYNLDSTWDAGRSSYSYFLTTDANFGDHTRNSEYATEAFYAAYPMATTNYAPPVTPGIGGQWGSAGPGVSWALDDAGLLTISGNGEIADYSSAADTPWGHIREYVRGLVIEEGITAVGSSAFRGCSNMTWATLPEGLTTIGINAFQNCQSLQSVNIPSTTGRIQAYAFDGCLSLPEVTLPAGVSYVGAGAFKNCSSMKQIQVAQNNPVYCAVDGILYSVDRKTLHTYPAGRVDVAFEVPAGVEVVYIHAFDGAANLTELTLPQGVTAIESIAFQNCRNLVSITLPGTLRYIGDSAFHNCKKLDDIYYWGTVQMWNGIEKEAYWNENAGACRVHYLGVEQRTAVIRVDAAVVTAGESVTVNLYLEDNPGISYLDLNILYDDTAMVRQSVQNGTVLELEQSSSNYLWRMEGNSTQNGRLISLQFRVEDAAAPGTYAITPVVNAARNASGQTVNIKLISGTVTVEARKPAEEGQLEFTLSDDGLSYIVSGIGSYSGQQLVIPSTHNGLPVTTIGQQAFYGCKQITSVTLSEGLRSIEFGAFGWCKNLKTISLPSTLTTIGYNVFSECSALESITIPAGVTKLGGGVFSGCSSLQAIGVDAGNTCYQAVDGVVYTTDGKTLVAYPSGKPDTSFTAPAGVETVFDYAFDSARNLQEVFFLHGLQRLESACFQACFNLTSVTLPDTVTFIGSYTFGSCSKLAAIYYSGTEKSWNAILKIDGWDEGAGDYTVIFTDPCAAGHTWLEATCEAPKTCAVCGITEGEPEPHHYSYTVTVVPTEKEPGLLAGRCDNCRLILEVTMPRLSPEDYVLATQPHPTDTGYGIVRYTWKETAYGIICVDVTFRYGDANGDGAINGMDVLLLRRYLSNYNYDTGVSTVDVSIGADVDGNGKIGGKDVVLLRKYMVNYDYDTGISSITLGP